MPSQIRRVNVRSDRFFDVIYFHGKAMVICDFHFNLHNFCVRLFPRFVLLFTWWSVFFWVRANVHMDARICVCVWHLLRYACHKCSFMVGDIILMLARRVFFPLLITMLCDRAHSSCMPNKFSPSPIAIRWMGMAGTKGPVCRDTNKFDGSTDSFGGMLENCDFAHSSALRRQYGQISQAKQYAYAHIFDDNSYIMIIDRQYFHCVFFLSLSTFNFVLLDERIFTQTSNCIQSHFSFDPFNPSQNGKAEYRLGARIHSIDII